MYWSVAIEKRYATPMMMLPISRFCMSVQCLRYSALEDMATKDYNKKISFVGNRIPDTRADRVMMQRAITAVFKAMPSDI